ncbi:hypothetical protein C8J56DRAFT_939790 [Mycena floridula]|nr:hypothetical protein C8J56DRAFT_939790 [Mycena floridula]
MLSAKFILAAFSTFVIVSAAPRAGAAGALGHRSEQVVSDITICIDLPSNNCITFPMVDDQCVNLTGGFTPWNKAISFAQIPQEFVCTFFENSDCVDGGVVGQDIAVLPPGTWDLTQVQGLAGTQSFNDLTSSIICSVF